MPPPNTSECAVGGSSPRSGTTRNTRSGGIPTGVRHGRRRPLARSRGSIHGAFMTMTPMPRVRGRLAALDGDRPGARLRRRLEHLPAVPQRADRGWRRDDPHRRLQWPGVDVDRGRPRVEPRQGGPRRPVPDRVGRPPARQLHDGTCRRQRPGCDRTPRGHRPGTPNPTIATLRVSSLSSCVSSSPRVHFLRGGIGECHLRTLQSVPWAAPRHDRVRAVTLGRVEYRRSTVGRAVRTRAPEIGPAPSGLRG